MSLAGAVLNGSKVKEWRGGKCQSEEAQAWVAEQLSTEQNPVDLQKATDAWFPQKGGDAGKRARCAKAVCNGDDGRPPCPLLYTCREYAIEANEKYGIWGGMSEQDRAKLRRCRRRTVRERGKILRREHV